VSIKEDFPDLRKQLADTRKDYSECRAQLQSTVLLTSASTAELSNTHMLLLESRANTTAAEASNLLLKEQADRQHQEILKLYALLRQTDTLPATSR
jgi:hypothetical protein